MAKDKSTNDQNLELANLLLKKINKKAGVKVASKLSDNNQTNIKNWISIGNDVANIVISNKIYGGIPSGRISVLGGAEGCVTEDTEINCQLKGNDDFYFIKLKVGEVKLLLEQNRIIKIQGLHNNYNRITDFIEKGMLETYKVILVDDYSNINVSEQHIFMSSDGWVETKDLIINKTEILCNDDKYRKVESVESIGLQKIVDITVEDEHAYFGNKMYNHNSGKSLLCVHMIKDIQRQGGIAVYFDTESATSAEFWEQLGVDTEKLILVNMEIIEDIYATIDEIILSVREKYEDKPVLIVLDSITSASSKTSIDSDSHELKGYATQKARVNSNSLKMIANNIARTNVALVITSQLRQKLGASLYEDPFVLSAGGDALKFYASLILRLRSSGKIKEVIDGVEHVVGVKAACTVTKSRFGTLHNQTKFNVYFASGVENVGSWLEELKKYKLVKGGAGGHFKIDIINKDTGEFIEEDYKFRSDKGFMAMIKEHPEWKTHILSSLAGKLIMKTKKPDDYEKENLLFESNMTAENEETLKNVTTISDSISED